jgi:peptide deformylase
MSKILKKTEFGNPLLRSKAHQLNRSDILSQSTQELIKNMYFTLEHKKYGVGLSATQIGKSLAISTIDTKPTPTRPDLIREKLTIINPEIIKTYGHLEGQYEGCISGSEIYAKVLRYKKVRLRWKDEKAKEHERDFDGFLAHVIQHEADHTNGILFVDKVKDTTSYMTTSEYKKMITREKAQF